jgi:hypothetical protein
MENKQLIIDKALENMRLATGIEPIKRTKAEIAGSDATVTIHGLRFAIKAVGQVTTANTLSIVRTLKNLQEKTKLPVLLVCSYISPTVIQTFKEEGLSILDVAGNCLITSGNVFINVQGRKPEKTPEPVSKALTEAGVKLVFYFLLEKTNVAKTYRKIHEDTGLSLGLIKNYIKNLKDWKYLTIHNNSRILINRDGLVEVWQQAFNSTLKPKLFIGRMRFVNADARREWRSIALPEQTCWGGEPGANLIDGYLTPETFTIYTEAAQKDFLKTRKLIPAPDGEVMLYQKFWNNGSQGNIAPLLTIYADLMGSGDSRCLEAAQRLKEYGL